MINAAESSGKMETQDSLLDLGYGGHWWPWQRIVLV